MLKLVTGAHTVSISRERLLNLSIMEEQTICYVFPEIGIITGPTIHFTQILILFWKLTEAFLSVYAFTSFIQNNFAREIRRSQSKYSK